MTPNEAKALIHTLNDVFFLARIVDPITTTYWEVDDEGRMVPAGICYHVWNRNSPCDHCISKKTCVSSGVSDKYETMGQDIFHITSKPIEIDGVNYSFEIVSKMDNKDDIYRREMLLREQEQNMEIIRILASEYSAVYYVDLQTDMLDAYTMNAETESELGQIFDQNITYSEAFRLYVERLVHPEDRARMLRAGSLQNIFSELEDQKTYITQYRSTNNRYCEMKFVKVNAENEKPTAVALGFSDRDEEVRLQKEYERNQEIIQTLSAEYSAVYHVDLTTGELTVSKVPADREFYVRRSFKNGMQFTDALRMYLQLQIKNGDYEELLRFEDADYIKSLLREKKVYTRNIRVGTEDNFVYNEIKIVKVNDEPEATGIVLGFAEKDEIIRRELAEEVERRRNTEIIEILASEYTSVYYIDLTTDGLTPYTMNEETENQFGVLFKNMSYSEAFRMYVDRLIYAEDKTKMLRAGSIGNIMRELRSKKTFITTYRSDNNGHPRYCEMKFVKVGGEDEMPLAVALGFADKDTELRNVIEQETIRKRNTEIIEILASEYTSVYYIDLMTGELDPYTMNQETEMAFGSIFRSGIQFAEAFRMYVENNVYSDDREKMLRAGSIYNILIELRDKKSFQTTFRSSGIDGIHYCEMKFVKVGEDENPRAVALGFSIVDEAYQQALEAKQREEFINGLADDYEAVYHANLDTGILEPIRVRGEYKMRVRIPGGSMSFEKFVDFVKEYVIPEDRNSFVEKLTAENVNRAFSESNAFFYNYRIRNGDAIAYRQLKVIHTGEWRKDHNFLIGVHNMDEATKEQIAQEEILKEARIAAEAASRAKTSFLFNMSHDIRTPMNAIIGFNNMAVKHLDETEKAKGYLDKVRMSSEHLLSLINDVLDMARIESGKVTIEEDCASITGAATDLSNLMLQTIKDKQLYFSADFSDIKHDSVYADVLRVNRVLMNILSNAAKYTRPGGSIKYTIHEIDSERPGYASFDFIIEDTGIGMTEEFQKHIFEAFSRESDSTLSGVQGTGLGMAITKELIDMMHGSIRIQSKVNVGTTVVVHLDFRIAEEIAAHADTTVPENDLSVFEGKKVLLVEDNPLNREIAVEILAEYGMVVEEAENGAIALDMVRDADPEHFYDLVLMDIQMPVMNGYTAAEEIRKLSGQRFRDLPIIAMTANAFAEDKKRALDSGMNAHIAKPINMKEFTRTLLEFE